MNAYKPNQRVSNTRTIYSNYLKGFTLIELLVVISIIGLLSSVILASLNEARAKARDTSLFVETKQLQTALEMYYNQNHKYPNSTQDSPAVYFSSVEGNATNAQLRNSLVPIFMPAMPNPGLFTNTNKSGNKTSRLMYRRLTDSFSMPSGCSSTAGNCYTLAVWPETSSVFGPAGKVIYFYSNGDIKNGYNGNVY